MYIAYYAFEDRRLDVMSFAAFVPLGFNWRSETIML